jgi:hypothetical protein
MLCDAEITRELPLKLVEDVTYAPETYPTCEVCQEVHAPGHCPPAKLCWRNHSYYGQTCLVCQHIERGWQMLARDMLRVQPEASTVVPEDFYKAFAGDPKW